MVCTRARLGEILSPGDGSARQLRGYSQVDMLRPRYKSVNFGAGKSPGAALTRFGQSPYPLILTNFWCRYSETAQLEFDKVVSAFVKRDAVGVE